MDNNLSKKVCFPVNQYGWILLFQVLGKTIVRTCKMSKVKRISDETNQHKMFEFECESGVKVKSKFYDTSKFWE